MQMDTMWFVKIELRHLNNSDVGNLEKNKVEKVFLHTQKKRENKIQAVKLEAMQYK